MEPLFGEYLLGATQDAKPFVEGGRSVGSLYHGENHGEEILPVRAALLDFACDHTTHSLEIEGAAGATAIFPSEPFERRLRDCMTASQQVQARVQNYQTAGRCLMGLEPDTTMFL